MEKNACIAHSELLSDLQRELESGRLLGDLRLDCDASVLSRLVEHVATHIYKYWIPLYVLRSQIMSDNKQALVTLISPVG